MAGISAFFWAILCTQKAPLYISPRILRDAFIVLNKDCCVDINLYFLFVVLSSFYSSKLTWGGTNTQFSGVLFFKNRFHIVISLLTFPVFLNCFCKFCLWRFIKVRFFLNTINFWKSHSFILKFMAESTVISNSES